MRLLLDTHVWIWSQVSPDRIGTNTQTELLNSANALFVSPVSTLEISRLCFLKRLQLTMGLKSWVAKSLEFLKAQTVDFSHDIGVESYNLPEPFHRDPADRMLVATARLHGLQLVTVDENLLHYSHVATLDARK